MRRFAYGLIPLLVLLAPGAFSSAQNAAPTPPSAPAQVDAVDFLNVASQEVQKYIETFGDLTADETRKIEIFDEHGFPKKSRTMTSSLVVYRLQSDPKQVTEYRDIATVDGKPISDHADRAVKIWQELSHERSPEAEEQRIISESERYDYGVKESDLTLKQGLPLRQECRGDFEFRELPAAQVAGRDARVFEYRQIHPCSEIKYQLARPEQFAAAPLVNQGRIWLDAGTAQVIREQREVYVGSDPHTQWRIVHMSFDYAPSTFGLLLPSAIRIEIYYPEMAITSMITRLPVVTRITQTYGAFSRFQVTVGVKNATADQK